jgi:toxin ParE1/3/4
LALRDLKSIGRYIASEDPVAAGEFDERLLARAQSLTVFPYRHGSWAGLPQIRKVPLGSYIIFYKIYDDEKTVEILRFRHAARDQGRLRLKEESTYAYSVSPSITPTASI